MSPPRRDELDAAAHTRLTMHQLASELTSTIDDLPDFLVYCAAVDAVSTSLVVAVEREREREEECDLRADRRAFEGPKIAADRARTVGPW